MRGRTPPLTVAAPQPKELSDETQELIKEIDAELNAVPLKQKRRRQKPRPIDPHIKAAVPEYRMLMSGVLNHDGRKGKQEKLVDAAQREQDARIERERQAVRRAEKEQQRLLTRARKGGVPAIVTVSDEFSNDPDFEKIKEEIRDYFGSERRIAIVRASSLALGEVPDHDQVG